MDCIGRDYNDFKKKGGHSLEWLFLEWWTENMVPPGLARDARSAFFK